VTGKPAAKGDRNLPRPPRRGFSVGRVHRFSESLALSNAYADAEWWIPIYRQAFPRWTDKGDQPPCWPGTVAYAR